MSVVRYDDLNPRFQAFIDEYIARGGSRIAATQAVMEVYGYDSRAATVQANRLLKNPRILAVLKDMTIASFGALAVLANEQLAEILTTGMWHGKPVKASDGIRAIFSALERGVGPVVQRTEIDVNDSRSTQELKAAIVQKLETLNPEDRSTILKSLKATAIDADVSDVDEDGFDPNAPWGRKEDGTPKQKPGAKPVKIQLTGPQAYKPPPETIHDIKKKLLQRRMHRIRAGKQEA